MYLNAAVRLPCLKPSNLATLTWTSAQVKNLSQNIFIQSADGSLSFFATAHTFGTYRCEAEEGGYKEVVTSYDVRQTAPPRSTALKGDTIYVYNEEDEPFEDIMTKTPMMSATQPAADTEDDLTEDNNEEPTTSITDETKFIEEDPGLTAIDGDSGLDFTAQSDAGVNEDLPDNRQMMTKEKSYYSELVAVSLLLAVSICLLMLAALHVWRQSRTGLKNNSPLCPQDGSNTNESMESVPSLSSPEEPQVTVVE